MQNKTSKITENSYIQSVNKSIDFMELHYSEKITLEMLAAEGCFSAWHFHRIFKGIVGENPQEYLSRVRLEKAVMLMNQKYSITEIALAAGFSSSSHFSQTFKKHYNVSPKQWHSRELIKRNAGRQMPCADFSDQRVSVKIQNYPPLSVAYIRNIGSYDFKIGFAWKRLMAWARKNDLVSGSSHRLSCSWDSPELTPDGKLRYDACIILPADIDASIRKNAPVSFRSIEGGRYAVFLFEGNLSDLTSFYDTVYGDLLPRSDLRLRESIGYRVHFETAAEQMRGICRQELRVPLV